MKLTVFGAASLAAALLLTACEEGDDLGAADAAPAADAVPQPDGAGFLYPSGPFGTGPEDTIEDITWLGFVDGDDPDTDHANDPLRLFSLHEYHQANAPDAKVIMINSAAGWCGPCQQEAAESPILVGEYYPQGVRFISAVFEDDQGNPADRAFVEYWNASLDPAWPTMVDSTFLMGKYFDENAMPMNMFVDARTMEIVAITTGADTPTFRTILDYMLQQQQP